ITASEAVSSDLPPQFPTGARFITAILAWPVGLAALARGLRWPQLIRPLALTLFALALAPICLLIGEIGALTLRGDWAELTDLAASASLLIGLSWLHVVLYVFFTCLVFTLFLGWAALRADREYRRLVPDAGRNAPPHRALFSGLTLVASVAYAAFL